MAMRIEMDGFPLFAVLVTEKDGCRWIETDWTEDQDKAEDWADEIRAYRPDEKVQVVMWCTCGEIEVEEVE